MSSADIYDAYIRQAVKSMLKIPDSSSQSSSSSSAATIAGTIFGMYYDKISKISDRFAKRKSL
jgi:hypothetical protein